ncbi:motility associated factor glycosyltransferase family protein [Marinomonas balearica]|nr:6-hydroxymethylpterin diphosphokinase MptE-like protein [Marinomonas balearica]
MNHSSTSKEQLIKRFHQGVELLKDNDQVFTDRYIRNVEVFKTYFPDIYQVMDGYSPIKKSVFLEEDGGLNLFDTENETVLFTDQPFSMVIDNVKAQLKKPHRTELKIGKGSNKTRHEFYMDKFSAYLDKSYDEVSAQESMPEYVPSMLMFGLEFGYNLYFLYQEVDIQNLYIYEPDLDFLYYSLFTIEWLDIVEKANQLDARIHLSVGITEQEFVDKYYPYIFRKGLYLAPVTYMYFSLSFREMKDAAKTFSEQYARQVYGWGFFDDAMIGVSQSIAAPSNKEFFTSHYQPNDRSLRDIPIFIVANGPSLDQNIDFIRQHRDSVILVCCGTTINTLHRLGIKPDFHVDVERMRITVDKIELVPEEFRKGVAALTANVIHPDFYKLFDRVGVSLKPGEVASTIMQKLAKSSDLELPLLFNSAPIVANTALAYFTMMMFRNIYLIGVDCGFKDKDHHHSIHSGYYKDGKNTHLIHYYHRRLDEVEGNFGGVFYTDFVFGNSKLYLETAVAYAKKTDRMFRCYNMSDGVKIEGSIPLRPIDYLPSSPLRDRKSIIDKIFSTHFTGSESLGSLSEEFARMESELDSLFAYMKSGWVDSEDLSRAAVMRRLAEFNDSIGNYYNTDFHAIYELVIGSFTYFACYMSLFLYQNEHDSSVLEDTQVMYDHWCDFVDEMKEMFHDVHEFIDKGDSALMAKYNA